MARAHTLSRERVLRAAVAILDRDGLAALSMRHLGAELGVEAMSLYHHVSGKEDVLDGVVELVVADSLPEVSVDLAWRGALRTYALGLREGLRRRPHVLPLLLGRPVTTPAMHSIMERVLRLLQQGGFRPEQALAVVRGVTVLVLGHVADPVEPSDEDPTLSGADHRHAAAAFAAAQRLGPQAQFTYSLDCLLDGYEASLPGGAAG